MSSELELRKYGEHLNLPQQNIEQVVKEFRKEKLIDIRNELNQIKRIVLKPQKLTELREVAGKIPKNTRISGNNARQMLFGKKRK
jgi:hypothetical protein